MNRGGGAVVERKEATGAIEVQALALKDILRELQTVDFMKMDIEGAEYEVILGTSAEELRAVKFLALEYHPSPVHGVDEIVRHLQTAGFSVCRGSRGRMLYAWQEGWNG